MLWVNNQTRGTLCGGVGLVLIPLNTTFNDHLGRSFARSLRNEQTNSRLLINKVELLKSWYGNFWRASSNPFFILRFSFSFSSSSLFHIDCSGLGNVGLEWFWSRGSSEWFSSVYKQNKQFLCCSDLVMVPGEAGKQFWNTPLFCSWPSWSWWSTSPVLPTSPGKGCWWWWQLQGPLCQEKFNFQGCLSFPESYFPCSSEWIGCTARKWNMKFLSAFPLPLATSKSALWCHFNSS